MKFKLFLFALISALFNCKAQQLPLYVGTYTDGDSEGIYKMQFNAKTGTLSDKQLAIAIENPSFITFSPDKKFIYAVGEGSSSAVTALKVKMDGTLKFVNKVSSEGKGPCYVSVNGSGNKAVVSNYVGGTMALYNINADGSLNNASQVFDHNTAEQKSHAHSAQFYGNDLYSSDLGRNAVYLYQTKDGKAYELKTPSIVEMTENAGPRHFSLTKDGQFIYIINEYASTITSAKKVDGHFELINHTSTLSDEYKGHNSSADIHLSKDETFLYGSNRGENSIAVFKRDVKTGMIEKIQNMNVHGDWPRNFTLDPSGKFLLVANQKSHNISVFNIEPSTGKLSFLQDVKVTSPVCLLF
ncbi:lactonase family protein [Mariniflexile sp.]|uniref:lactonase family protein n=1 Tax=Mariniflexile sp. TaxID=1979402 RepID=UPI0040489207